MSDFWTSAYEEGTIKDPKRKFRFTVTMSGLTTTLDSSVVWYAKTCTKPSFQIATAEHKYLNHTFLCFCRLVQLKSTQLEKIYVSESLI